ncbi:MAG: ATP-binding protein [Halothiobacillus sp.]|jgi:predicted AAA+ superfamily ATPase|nr:ATP-binding protein [Halothiobacillus sp.]
MSIPFRSKLTVRKLQGYKHSGCPDTAQAMGRRLRPHPHALAQRWVPERGFIQIEQPALEDPKDILHRARQLDQIDRNTRLFLSGKPANHVLLWGARGTGKSAMIRAMLTRYGGEDFGVIELDHAGLSALADLIQILTRTPRRYVLFVDDLSFEAQDMRYKSLKALLDGSLMTPSVNILVYATSNRRHLLPESMQDNLEGRVIDGELHEGDAIDEKVSLSERFGLWLAFHPFSQEQYLDIVRAHLTVGSIGDDERGGWNEGTEWQVEALRFARLRGSRSGRVAAQFVQYWNSMRMPASM